VLKAARIGGLLAAREIATCALQAEFSVVVTDSIEGVTGMSAAVHLAASLPAPRRAIGLGGARLLDGCGAFARPHLRAHSPGLQVNFDTTEMPEQL
jgi:L-alanine-DL-glutamate epimerase-like enolase superfamily enzyme